MTNKPIDFVVLNENNHDARRVLVACKALRDNMSEQKFVSDIESIYLIGCLIDAAEDAAVVAMLERP
jgi:hypothetical protein